MKICVIGAFFFEEMRTGGQPVKTRTLYYALQDMYGKKNISYIETAEWKFHPIRLLTELKKAFVKCENIIILPARNGIRIFAPLLVMFKMIYKKKIYYDVIGGWLPEFLSNRNNLKRNLRRFDGIWVETENMKQRLEQQHMTNVDVVYNFKDLSVLEERELVYSKQYPLKMCTFSRVMKEKGIEDAISAVKEINRRKQKTVVSLDIYGHIDVAYTDRFNELQRQFPDYIKYCGCAKPDKSVEVLKNYFLLLFPTAYEGEGFAGTLTDAFSAGVPVVASDWRYNEEVVNESTGFLFHTGDVDSLAEVLQSIVENPDTILEKKANCLKEASKYQLKTCIKRIDALLNHI